MASEWFVRINHDKIGGPYTASQLKQAAQAGRIHPQTVVRKGREGEWIRADRVQGLLEPAEASAGQAADHSEIEGPSGERAIPSAPLPRRPAEEPGMRQFARRQVSAPSNGVAPSNSVASTSQPLASPPLPPAAANGEPMPIAVPMRSPAGDAVQQGSPPSKALPPLVRGRRNETTRDQAASEPNALVESESADKQGAQCPYCLEKIMAGAKKCKHCGEYLVHGLTEQRTATANPYASPSVSSVRSKRSTRRLLPALLLWWLLGAFGAHAFYAGNVGQGIAYLVLCVLTVLTLGLGIVFVALFMLVDLIRLLAGAYYDDQGYPINEWT